MRTRSTTVVLVVTIGLHLALATRLRALAVGDIVVRSPLGKPFVAEIPLQLEPQERAQGVAVTLGDQKEYRAEGLTRPAVLETLEATVTTGPRHSVRVSSRDPLQVPAFDLLLLVRSGQVTIVKTYHVVVPAPPSSPPQAAMSPAVATRSKPEKTAPLSPPPSAAKKSSPTPPPPLRSPLPARYGPVQSGMTLYGVAEDLGVSKDALWQTVVLLWQANKPEFLGGNLHGLRTGTYLAVPANLAGEVTTMTRAEAQRIVAEQWDAWQALRQTAGGRQQITPPEKEPVVLARKPSPPKPETTPSPAVAPVAEGPPPPAAIALPAGNPLPVAGGADVRALLQRAEELLAQRTSQTSGVGDMLAFVKTAELQTALQGLEERIMQRLQEALKPVADAQRELSSFSRSAAALDKQTLLEQWLPTNSIAYVLMVENALLLLLAGGMLWRWYRSRA